MSSAYKDASSRLEKIAGKCGLAPEKVLANLLEHGFKFYVQIPSDLVAVAVNKQIFDGHGVDNRQAYAVLNHIRPFVLKSARMLEIDAAGLLNFKDFWCTDFAIALQLEAKRWAACDIFSSSAETGRRLTLGGTNIILQLRPSPEEYFGERYSDLRTAEPIQVTVDNLHVHPEKVGDAEALLHVDGKEVDPLLDLSPVYYTKALIVLWDIFRETWFLRDLTVQEVRDWKRSAIVELKARSEVFNSANSSETALKFITPRDLDLFKREWTDGVVKPAGSGEIDPRFDCLLKASDHFWKPYFEKSAKSNGQVKIKKASQKNIAQYILDSNGELFTQVESKVAAMIINPFPDLAKRKNRKKPLEVIKQNKTIFGPKVLSDL
ncbi:hypothetical protein [Acidovorax sp. RAC01]|uniref:hypothetical protein n=1 Tax=Acidovorax sp. RAC01 TaxID=1842533 RepID=UPI000855582D|nr:hypothetical protein [Acidovorax sp. RAC01]AOG24273.1 hypothetical protein BSY15_3315 [Acidovorax sp. RAC01]